MIPDLTVRRAAGRHAARLLAVLLVLLPAAAHGDLRSTEILRYGCGSEFSRREITLFANGTVRLRQGPWEAQELYLDELTPEALEANLRLLRDIHSDRELDRILEPVGRGPDGNWTEHCEVYLALPERDEPLRYEFSSYDIPPLAIARVIQVAEALADFALPITEEERLPADYEPQFGDVLRTVEGLRFQVLRLTVDRKGVELQGIDQPMRLYVALDDLATAFTTIEHRENEAWWWR